MRSNFQLISFCEERLLLFKKQGRQGRQGRKGRHEGQSALFQGLVIAGLGLSCCGSNELGFRAAVGEAGLLGGNRQLLA